MNGKYKNLSCKEEGVIFNKLADLLRGGADLVLRDNHNREIPLVFWALSSDGEIVFRRKDDCSEQDLKLSE